MPARTYNVSAEMDSYIGHYRSEQAMRLAERRRTLSDVTENLSKAQLRRDLVEFRTPVDAVVLELPFQPMCTEDCPGLCTECGARLAEDPDHAHEAPIDPRWAGLQDLQQDLDEK